MLKDQESGQLAAVAVRLGSLRTGKGRGPGCGHAAGAGTWRMHETGMCRALCGLVGAQMLFSRRAAPQLRDTFKVCSMFVEGYSSTSHEFTADGLCCAAC